MALFKLFYLLSFEELLQELPGPISIGKILEYRDTFFGNSFRTMLESMIEFITHLQLNILTMLTTVA